MKPWLVALIAALLLACREETPPPPVAGAELRTRAETRLLKERAELRKSIGHYGLVFDVEQEEIRRFLAQIWLRRDGSDIVMGGVHGVELHGGGVLGLIAEYWRPDSRRPRLSDRYPFSWSRSPVALEEIYQSHRNQIFLPVPGLTMDGIDGQLPASPQLPRMRFQHAAQGRPEISEADSYTFLGMLLAYEPDRAATWTNRLNQRMSVDSLLRNAWDHYAVQRTAREEFDDHSYLHLVEVLLAFHRTRESQRDPNEIKQRFLSTELRRTEFGGYEASEALGHYVESLGLLLSGPDIAWSDDEKQQVRDWLEDLETNRLREVEGLPVRHLAHLVRGLRLVEENAARLQ
jgi:hypothetical protein